MYGKSNLYQDASDIREKESTLDAMEGNNEDTQKKSECPARENKHDDEKRGSQNLEDSNDNVMVALFKLWSKMS